MLRRSHSSPVIDTAQHLKQPHQVALAVLARCAFLCRVTRGFRGAARCNRRQHNAILRQLPSKSVASLGVLNQVTVGICRIVRFCSEV